MNIWKIVSIGCSIVAGVTGIVSGVADQKVMVQEVAKQVGEALSKK